jgi:hypothetical protein
MACLLWSHALHAEMVCMGATSAGHHLPPAGTAADEAEAVALEIKRLVEQEKVCSYGDVACLLRNFRCQGAKLYDPLQKALVAHKVPYTVSGTGWRSCSCAVPNALLCCCRGEARQCWAPACGGCVTLAQGAQSSAAPLHVMSCHAPGAMHDRLMPACACACSSLRPQHHTHPVQHTSVQLPHASCCSCCPWLQIVRGSDVLKSEVVRVLLAHLRTGISPHDDEAFEAASRGPPRRLGDAFWQGLREARDALLSTEGKVGGVCGLLFICGAGWVPYQDCSAAAGTVVLALATGRGVAS